MPFRAVILGASGYGGGELIRMLSSHPECSGIQGTSRNHVGQPFGAVHPNLKHFDLGEFQAEPDWNWLAESEYPVVFASMPHGAFGEQAQELLAKMPANAIVIDLSGDHRLKTSAEYERWYGKPHPNEPELANWVYGLTEVNRDQIKSSNRIANPGCFATAIQLGLWPLVKNQLELQHVAITGATGSSGSGNSPSATTHHPARANDYRAYKVLSHQHGGEIDQLVKNQFTWSFVPVSAPMVRGIFATLQFKTSEKVLPLFEESYANEPFVKLVKDTPRLAAINTTNFAEISVHQNGEDVAVLVGLDNLMKGMAGQAIQNLNVRLSYQETLGLHSISAFPA